MRISDWSSDCALPISSLPVAGLPETLDYRRGERARTLEGLSVAAPGNLAIAVYDGNALIAEAGPLLIRDGRHAGDWGDLHGQSGESIGIGASRSEEKTHELQSLMRITYAVFCVEQKK